MRAKEFTAPDTVGLRMQPILLEEGIGVYQYPPGVQRSQRLIEAAVRLFDFIPNSEDFRWHLAYEYAQAKEVGFNKQNLENALRATYLSTTESRRNGKPSTTTERNVRQVSRALKNIGARRILQERYAASRPDMMPDHVRYEFTPTNRVQEDNKQRPIPIVVTPCPEALYQLRIYRENEYLARLGFNIHFESGQMIASIVNMQGRKDGAEFLQGYSGEFGESAFNVLVRRMKALATSDPDNPIHLRGLKNPRAIERSGLYNSVFKREGIPRFSTKEPATAKFVDSTTNVDPQSHVVII
ncbi:MAG: hypothetical protein RLZZ455_553 [Candidatus Parcubacteria bacterium]|jgi:hypothetical protein